MREALPANVKLQVVLRYLATGDSFPSLEALYRIPKSSISKFLSEELHATYEALENFIEVNINKKQTFLFLNGTRPVPWYKRF